MVKISASAAQEIKRIQRSRQKDSHLRLSIKTGGCNGRYYSFELNETVGERDRCYENDGFLLLIDEDSSAELEGLTIDYSEDLMGGGFRFYNPHASATCSCGLSFSPK